MINKTLKAGRNGEVAGKGTMEKGKVKARDKEEITAMKRKWKLTVGY